MLIFLSATAPTRFYPLSLHDALPIFRSGAWLAERLPLRLTDAVANLGGRIAFRLAKPPRREIVARNRSEEHTSELQSRVDLVCRLLLEKKKRKMLAKAAVYL